MRDQVTALYLSELWPRPGLVEEYDANPNALPDAPENKGLAAYVTESARACSFT